VRSGSGPLRIDLAERGSSPASGRTRGAVARRGRDLDLARLLPLGLGRRHGSTRASGVEAACRGASWTSRTVADARLGPGPRRAAAAPARDAGSRAHEAERELTRGSTSARPPASNRPVRHADVPVGPGAVGARRRAPAVTVSGPAARRRRRLRRSDRNRCTVPERFRARIESRRIGVVRRTLATCRSRAVLSSTSSRVVCRIDRDGCESPRSPARAAARRRRTRCSATALAAERPWTEDTSDGEGDTGRAAVLEARRQA
jgi:hypothetical protein